VYRNSTWRRTSNAEFWKLETRKFTRQFAVFIRFFQRTSVAAKFVQNSTEFIYFQLLAHCIDS